MTDSMVRQYLASDAAREHYEKTLPDILFGGDRSDASNKALPELGVFVASETASIRISQLEAEVAKFEQHVKNYGVVVELMLADLLNLDRLYKKTLTERDMLATRCAAQAHELAELLSPPIRETPDPVFSAIEVHQKQGVR